MSWNAGRLAGGLSCLLVAGVATAAEPGAADEGARQAPPSAEAEAAATEAEDETETSGPKGPPEPTFMVAPRDEVTWGVPPRTRPLLSVGQGTFCFIEDASCKASLLAFADIGAGFNAIESDEAFDVPYTQFRVGGGFTVRPLTLAGQGWHPWSTGLVVSHSWGSGSVLPGTDDSTFVERDVTRALRIGLVQQLWFGPRRNALHVDAIIGVVRSNVFNAVSQEAYSGTNVELGLGFGGWGGVFVNGDFLDGDARIVMGFKGHALAAMPVAALVISGLLLGGVSLSGGGG